MPIKPFPIVNYEPDLVGLFGSHVRKSDNMASDIDLFMIFSPGRINIRDVVNREARRYMSELCYNYYVRGRRSTASGKIHLCVFDELSAFTTFLAYDNKEWIPLETKGWALKR